MWSSSSRQINYGLQHEMGMFGLRDVFVVAPASSFNHNNNNSNHHHHQQEFAAFDPHSVASSNAATALGVGVGVGVFPLAATPFTDPENIGLEDDNLNCNRGRINSGIQLWQQVQQSNYLKKPMFVEDSSGGGIASTSGMTCLDCGNQAKKDCSHRRCRSCCRSRGFDCPTHIKSTWVPAARRRERQLMAAAAAGAGSSGSISSAKKPRLLVTSQTTTNSPTSTSNTPPRSFDTSSSHQEASFKESLPSQVRVPALFKCVRVTSVEDGEDEFAYQASVNIGGHVFKGFLYDQGVDTRDGFPNISALHMGERNFPSSSSPVMDPSNIYTTPSGRLVRGSGYGNSLN